MLTERKESMSPNGFLRLIRQEDGDIVVTVGAQTGHDSDEALHIASVEFCTPFTGGGGSRHTYSALVQLMGAMADDNLDTQQRHRQGDNCETKDQVELVKWAARCREKLL